MNTVYGICGNVNRALETECHICSVNIIINGLRKMDDIQSLFPEQICSLLRTITTENNEAV